MRAPAARHPAAAAQARHVPLAHPQGYAPKVCSSRGTLCALCGKMGELKRRGTYLLQHRCVSGLYSLLPTPVQQPKTSLIHPVLRQETPLRSAQNKRPTAVDLPPTAAGHRPTAFGCLPPAVDHRSTAVGYHPQKTDRTVIHFPFLFSLRRFMAMARS